MLFALVVVTGSLGLLFLGGWTFLERSFYKDQENKDRTAKVIRCDGMRLVEIVVGQCSALQIV